METMETMETSWADRLESVLTDFAARYATVSRDGVVEATLGARGWPVRIRFVDRRFREIPAAQLADSVLESLVTGRAETAARRDAVTAAVSVWRDHAVPAARVCGAWMFGHMFTCKELADEDTP